MSTPLRDPVRTINAEFLAGLEMVSTKVFPLAGATGRRQDSTVTDSRLSGLAGQTPVGDTVTYYEHIASVRHQPTNTFFVAFRETMDAFLARQADPAKYPEWLIKSPEKQAERRVHIYMVKCHPDSVSILRSHEDWLSHVADPSIFDSLAFFLNRHQVIDDKVYATTVR